MPWHPGVLLQSESQQKRQMSLRRVRHQLAAAGRGRFMMRRLAPASLCRQDYLDTGLDAQLRRIHHQIVQRHIVDVAVEVGPHER